MKFRIVLLTTLAAFMLPAFSNAQVIIVEKRGRVYHPHPAQRPSYRKVSKQLPAFKPSLNISIGYGFPALDKNFLPEYYEAYSGNISQTGPITGSVDYRFRRFMSVGILAGYSKVSSPYYNFNNDPLPAFTARLENWHVMLNLTNYLAYGRKVSPYIHTALGINSWKQTYEDPQGNKVLVEPVSLPDFAYQVSAGARFRLSQHSGLFMEAGYGKYILQAGLSFQL